MFAVHCACAEKVGSNRFMNIHLFCLSGRAKYP